MIMKQASSSLCFSTWRRKKNNQIVDFLFLSVEHGMRNVELSGQRTKECGQGLCLSQHNLDTMTA